MVKCELCKKEFKVIVEFHLKYHKITFKEYRKMFPNAPITDPYNCEQCDKLVTNSKSKRGKYCKKCAIIIKSDQIIFNARKYTREKKKILESSFTQANQEHGITINENSNAIDRIRIDPYHSAWDFIPKIKKGGKPLHNVKGTFTERSLEINKKTGRVKQAEWLQREITKIKEGRRR